MDCTTVCEYFNYRKVPWTSCGLEFYVKNKKELLIVYCAWLTSYHSPSCLGELSQKYSKVLNVHIIIPQFYQALVIRWFSKFRIYKLSIWLKLCSGKTGKSKSHFRKIVGNTVRSPKPGTKKAAICIGLTPVTSVPHCTWLVINCAFCGKGEHEIGFWFQNSLEISIPDF